MGTRKSNRAITKFQLWESDMGDKIRFDPWDISVKELIKASKSTDENIRRIVAEHEATPSRILSKLSEDEDEAVRAEVAKNDNTDPNILFTLCLDEHTWVRECVATNPNAPVKVMRELSRDPMPDVRMWLCANRSVTEDILVDIMERGESNVYVKREIAGKIQSHKFLSQLAEDPDTRVRTKVARNQWVMEYPDIVDKLVDSDESIVREIMVENPMTSIDHLVRLSQDNYGYISDQAKQKVEEYLEGADPEERKRVEGLIHMQELGIKPSGSTDLGDIDLSALDLGESNRAQVSFQLWEAAGKEEKRMHTTLGEFLDWYLWEDWESDWQKVKDYLWVNDKQLSDGDAMAYHIKFTRNRDLKLTVLGTRHGFNIHCYFIFEGIKFMGFDFPFEEDPNTPDAEEAVFHLNFLISWLEEDSIMKFAKKEDIANYFWSSIWSGVAIDDITPDGFKKWYLHKDINLN
jgi:hypothetical protein